MISNRQINDMIYQISGEREGIFRTYATQCKMPMVAHWVLYMTYYKQEPITQSELADIWCFPKQTVNSAVKKLEELKLVHLEPLETSGRSKAVLLTDSGEELCQKIMDPLIDAEIDAFDGFTQEERELYYKLSQKHLSALQANIEKLYTEKAINFDAYDEIRSRT